MTYRPRLHRLLSASSVLLIVAGGAALSVKLQVAERASATPVAQGHRARPLAGKVEPAAGKRVYWGTFRQDAPYVRAEVEAVRAETGAWPAIQMWYQEWDGRPDFDVLSARWLEARGIVPMVTWEPWRPPDEFGNLVVDQSEYSLARIAAGDLDPYIARYASSIRRFGGPVMLRPFHEMDGFWYPWGGLVNGNTPAVYVAAWRHVHDLFRTMGATNVTWVWSVNHRSVPDTEENQPAAYWPGRAYVDWIGISGFNWGSAGAGSVWKSFEDVYAERYAELLTFGRPIALTEVAAAELGGDKAAWITDAFATITARYPRVRAVIWYDKLDSSERDWRIGSSPESQAAFKAAMVGPRYAGGPAALRSSARP
jgi:hypothetical protein